MSAGVTVPIEAIVTLRRRLAALPARHPERQPLMASTAELYDISRATLYRLLRGERRPKDAHRADRGLSRTRGDDTKVNFTYATCERVQNGKDWLGRALLVI